MVGLLGRRRFVKPDILAYEFSDGDQLFFVSIFFAAKYEIYVLMAREIASKSRSIRKILPPLIIITVL